MGIGAQLRLLSKVQHTPFERSNTLHLLQQILRNAYFPLLRWPLKYGE
jgi:hypothetical protein